MTDIYQSIAANVADLRKQVETLTIERDYARGTRDAAQAASNRRLEEKRALEEDLRRTQRALTFAGNHIRANGTWTDICEDIIGGALK